MIKICYIIGQLTKGGAEKQLYYLASGIDKRAFHPAVITLSRGGYWAGKCRESGIEVIEIERKRSFEPARLFALIKYLREFRPEIVHTFLSSANSYGRTAAFLARVPIIIASERNLPEAGKNKPAHQLAVDKLLARLSDAIICNSKKAGRVLVEAHSIRPEKVFTVPNGINPSETPRTNNRGAPGMNGKGPILIGTVGRLTPQKNLKMFLDVAYILLRLAGNSRLKFLIAGGGPQRDELVDYAEGIGLAEKVVFTGERDDIGEILAQMHIFVTTSLFEGMPNVIMEAMLAGLPVVATNVGGVPELVIERKTGFLCPLKASYIADKVLFLIRNPEAAAEMGKMGRERILSEFSTARMVEGTVSVYRKFLK
jgi:glycosyltransferase involved in cell wall biosynthesis